ncbi:discoidin domain-containing protein [Dactylosporangium sp. AC04546]|uniref:discoidin domain-containing protein n=1 Tax=Dactylosporangium sp. AC04546 TaxID=2862460 RepID=UPI001EE0CC9F|nr:discoidin domain-containing protein [Dactylosporangium sp. AC04546]WVK79796.1 discoidin domain-containing protein [Dactylosporangium sp. AC04546]
MEVLIGGVAVPDGWLSASVPPDVLPAAADLVEPVRAAVRTGTQGVLLLVPGEVAAGLAGPLGLPVVAPAGPVVAAPGGALFAAAGWWRHTPGGRRVAEGPRWPAPAWQSLVPARTLWPAGVAVRPVPAGWALGAGLLVGAAGSGPPLGPAVAGQALGSAGGSAPGPVGGGHTLGGGSALSLGGGPGSALGPIGGGHALGGGSALSLGGGAGSALGPIDGGHALGGVDWLALAVAVDADRPRLVFDPAAGPEAVAAVLLALPTAVRSVTELVPLGAGQGAGRVVAAGAAQRIGEPVRLVNGVPLHSPGGEIVVCALDGALRPVWPEPAWLLRVLPDGTEEVLASAPPHATLRPLDAATYAMDLGWAVHVRAAALHALPAGSLPADVMPDSPAAGSAAAPADVAWDSPAAGSAAAGQRYRVAVGVAGAPIDDLLWPPLSALFTAALTDIPAAVELVVDGAASAWGLAAAQELAERYPGHPPAAGPSAGAPADGAEANPNIASAPTVRPFLAAMPVEMPPEPQPRPAGAGGTGRRRLAIVVSAAVAALVLLVAGIAAAWPDGGGGTDDAGGFVAEESVNGAPRTAQAPGSSGPASPSGRPSSARPSVSLSPQRSGPASSPPSSSPPPEVLDSGPNVAAGRPVTESSHTDVYTARNVTDADPMTYWESRNNAFPQWIQVNLGPNTDVGRVVFRLPPTEAWPSRTQRITVLGSRDGSSFTTLSAEATYTFAPSSGNRVEVTFARSQQRYVRLVFTANSVQAAGQLSSVEIYRA